MGNNQQGCKKLKKAIDSNDHEALRKLLDKGIDINMSIDDLGNTPLTLAIQRNHATIVKHLLRAQCDVEKKCRQQFSALEIVLLHLAHTEDEEYLDILRVLLQAGAETVSEVVVETLFSLMQSNLTLLYDIVVVVALYAEPRHEILEKFSNMMIQYNRIECFWAFLEHGVDLQDIWPNSCDKRFFLSGAKEKLMAASGTMASTVYCSLNPKFARMCIQAANDRTCLSSIVYFLLIYPIHSLSPEDLIDLLQCLTLAGYKLSQFLLSHLAKINKQAVQWYADYHKQPLDLRNLCRLAIRTSMKANVVYCSKVLPLPEPLKDYIMLKDAVN